MRNIFIDIGGWDGSSSEFFIKNHPNGKSFEVFIFECDKRNIDKIRKKNLGATLIEKAAWSSAGTQRYYYGKDDGGSLYSAKKTGGLKPNVYYDVKTIDIADFLAELFSPEDNIIMKLNCEGAEYEIIRRLHQMGMLGWIKKWYVQWHWKKIGLSLEEHTEIANMIPGHYGWDCQGRGESFLPTFLKSLKA